jgi:hypothetical protein
MGNLQDEDWFACPTCGSHVRVGSKGCGTCARDGDSEGLEEEEDEGPDPGLADIPSGYSGEDDFDYDEFIESEFEGKPKGRFNPVWIAVALAIFLLLLFLLLAVPLA